MSPRTLLAFSSLVLLVGCAASTPPKPRVEICGNGIDDNGDGKTDCADPTCFSAPFCKTVFEICDNGIDDNADGFTDCADPECAGDASCVKVEICGNGLDDFPQI